MAIKVCHVTSVHKPTDGRIFERECTSLTKYYDVTLIAPNVDDYEQNGVHIKGVRLPSNRLKRMFGLTPLFKKMVEVDADVYHFHDPELIRLGLKMKKRGKKVVFDSHEDVPLLILGKSYVPFRKLVSILYANYESLSLKKYDALVSVTPEIVDRLKQINDTTYMITNYPKLEGVLDNRQWQRRIGFAGMVNGGWKIHNIIEAIKDIDVTFDLAGPITEAYRKRLESLEGWTKVHYRGVVSHREVLEMLQECTVGMAVSTDTNPNIGMKKGSIGVTKLFEYMGLGIPVITTNLTSWVPIIEGGQCGFCVDCDDVEGIKKNIAYFLDNPDKAKEFGERGRRIAKESYSWESQEKPLFELYTKLFCISK